MHFLDFLKLVAAVLGVCGLIGGALTWLLWDKFSALVLQALKSQKSAYKEWNDSLYTEWRGEQVATNELARSTKQIVLQMREELVLHRAEIADVLHSAAQMPAALRQVATAVDSLKETVTQLGEDVVRHKVEIAVLKDRQERKHA